MEDKPDIEVGPLALGCLAGLVPSGLGLFLLFLLFSVAKIDWMRLRPEMLPGWVNFFGFTLGLAGEVLAGYVTACYARQAKKFHALIVGIVGMVLGTGAFVLPTGSPTHLTTVMAWLLCIPLTLWGGTLAVAEKKP